MAAGDFGTAVAQAIKPTVDAVQTGRLSEASLDATYVSLPTPQRYGAKGDGVNDDTAAIQTLLSSHSEAYIPPGVYAVTSTIVQTTCSVKMAGRAVIRAMAPMPNLWQIGTVDDGAVRIGLDGGVLDGNMLATPLLMMNFARFSLSNIKAWNSAGDGIVVGDPTTSNIPYEPLLDNVHIWRPSDSEVPAGSRGLYVRRASDGEYSNVQSVGAEIGIQVDTGSNHFSNIHTWGYPGHLPNVNFLDNGFSNVWIACVADSGITYGWHFTASGGVMLGCRVLASVYNADATMVGVRIGGSSKVSLLGTEFTGSVGHALKNNVSAEDMTGNVLLYSRNTSVNGKTPDGDYTPGRPTAAITSGEEVFSRLNITGSAAFTSQTLRLSYFTARNSETVTSIRVATAGTAAGATPTLVRLGVYGEDSAGNLTLVASTASDTTLLSSSSTSYTKAFSAPWSKVRGTRYAIGILVVTSATAPTLCGNTIGNPSEAAIAPRISGSLGGQSDLPSSINAESVGASANAIYAALVP